MDKSLVWSTKTIKPIFVVYCTLINLVSMEAPPGWLSGERVGVMTW